ncbi:MAG TPA: hypothetical protein VGR71_05040 [Nitrospira sp.]|nr:hypothetical protein [Nitrospira sp.]
MATTYSSAQSSQVATFARSGSNLVQTRWLGSLGHVMNLQYSFNYPGGCDKLSLLLEVEPTFRTDAMNPGRVVQVFRGGGIVWDGILDEPQPGTGGWTVTAVGTGNQGTNVRAFYTSTWPSGEPDQAINNAISRGLRWTNPGVGQPTGSWFGQAVDPGDQTISDLLNLVCARGGYAWYVNSQPSGGNVLSVSLLPTAPQYLLVDTTPVGRTLGGNWNTLFLRYQISADNATTGAPAVYGTVSVTNQSSVTLYGPMEQYVDLSNAGTMTATQAQAVGNYILAVYQRVTFTGPFVIQPGQLLTLGGQPVDLGCVQAGVVVQLVLTDYGYGGEVNPQFPISFIVGTYEWNDQTQQATITPYQTLNQNIQALLSLEGTLLTPITAG